MALFQIEVIERTKYVGGNDGCINCPALLCIGTKNVNKRTEVRWQSARTSGHSKLAN